MKSYKKIRMLDILCTVLMVAFAIAMFFLHYWQLCWATSGTDMYASDLGQHLYFAQSGMIYSATSLLIGPIYMLTRYVGISVLLVVFHLAAVMVFSWGLYAAVPQWRRSVRIVISLIVNLAQAVWMPRGGYWYLGTVTGTIYHNTTYIMLAPFALATTLWFYRVWQKIDTGLEIKDWFIYTVLLTVATAFKANFIFAFAPALLILLIVNFVRTKGRNIKNEVLMGGSVFPGVGLCFLQAKILFSEQNSGIRLIFTVDVDRHALMWGIFSEAAILGLLRSFVFVVAVAVLLKEVAWNNFRYRFSVFLCMISLAEAIFLVESGERIYHANLWWGAFICFWVLWLESVSALLRAVRDKKATIRTSICTIALCWHVISGAVYLGRLMTGISYGVPIMTYNLF